MVPVVYHGARECLPYGEWRVRAGSHIQVVLCEIIGLNVLILYVFRACVLRSACEFVW